MAPKELATSERLAMIAEFEDHSQAESAGHALKHEGFDMGNVSVVGADWLGSIGDSQLKTPSSASRLGAKIGGGVCAAMGFLIGGIETTGNDQHNRIPIVLAVILGWAACGYIVGACLGAIFGLIGRQDEAPNWAETEYGSKLRFGSYLLILYGGRANMDQAIATVDRAHPISIRVRPARDE